MTDTLLTQAQIAAGLSQSGFRLGPNQFTYSLPTAASTWPGYAAGSEPFSSYSILSAAQAAAFRAAIAQWDELIAPSFAELADDATTRGELRVAFTQMGSGTSAYAYSGTPQAPGGSAGDVWINSIDAADSFARGTYGYEVLLHEIGHTLGLKHPFEAPALPIAYDNRRYTIMSYSDPVGSDLISFAVTRTGGFRATAGFVVAVTPMVADIAAVQATYGADMTTRTGDTVYTFTQGTAQLETIYDAGGNDTIDLSNFTRSNSIDLRPGAYSSIGEYGVEAQIAAWTAQFPQYAAFIRNVLTQADAFTFTDNVGIAFSTTIENAIGGSAADRITGNDVANRLTGGGGDDVLTGGAGADVFAFAGTGLGADRITDFAFAEDRFDLAGRSFTGVSVSGANSLLTYAGGSVQIDGVSGRTLAEWNGRVIGAPTPVPVPTVPQFILLVPSAGAAIVQGAGTVFGVLGTTQDITVVDAPGRLSFEGSFNTGGDRIRLSGNASGYTVLRSGATVEISDGDTVIAVPVGTGGADIVFADGVRSLVANLQTGAVTLGGQFLTPTAATITAAPSAAVATDAAGPTSATLLLVNPGASATALGTATVFGTIAGAETVTVAAGAKLIFEGSFNAGGDTIVLPGTGSAWTVARSGATAQLIGSGGETIAIPAGPVGTTIRFSDGDRLLAIDTVAGALKLGGQSVGTTAATVVGTAAFGSDDIATIVPHVAAADFATFVV